MGVLTVKVSALCFFLMKNEEFFCKREKSKLA